MTKRNGRLSPKIGLALVALVGSIAVLEAVVPATASAGTFRAAPVKAPPLPTGPATRYLFGYVTLPDGVKDSLLPPTAKYVAQHRVVAATKLGPFDFSTARGPVAGQMLVHF